MNKRTFLKNLAVTGIAASTPFRSISESLKPYQHFAPSELASEEAFWSQIREGYRLKPDYINLENGYYCFLPQETLEQYIHHIREVNYQGSYYMRSVQWENKAKNASRLADFFGATPEELAITRNTTESLDLVIAGFPWQKGMKPSWPNRIMEACSTCLYWLPEGMGSTIKLFLSPTIPLRMRKLSNCMRMRLRQKPNS